LCFCFPRFLSWWTVPVPISKLKGKYIQNQCTLLSPPHPPSHPCLPPSLPRTSHTPALQGSPPESLGSSVLAFPVRASGPFPGPPAGCCSPACSEGLGPFFLLLIPCGKASASPTFSVPPRQLNSGDRLDASPPPPTSRAVGLRCVGLSAFRGLL
jgi:hypothetical protein